MKKKEFLRDEMLTRMAQAYYDLLTNLISPISKNVDVKNGIREGLNKFLSNVCISLVGKRHTDYYSEEALRHLLAGDASDLVYEHVVPKKIYQDEIVNSFIRGKGMSVEEIKEILNRYWLVATITKAEDARLPRQTMPANWDRKDVFARYRLAGIPLIERKEVPDGGVKSIPSCGTRGCAK